MTSQNNIHEMRIKKILMSWVSVYFSPNSGILINEFSANKYKSRADLVYLSKNDIVALEIKSENDTTNKLEKQILHLKKLYNRVEVVVAHKHEDKARKICLAENVGLHVVEENIIKTRLRGRRRKILSEHLEMYAFPLSEKAKKSFRPDEEYYRQFIFKKYEKLIKKWNQPVVVNEFTEVRCLNPHFVQLEHQRHLKSLYRQEMIMLQSNLQSTHSSSKDWDVTSIPESACFAR
jgi:hypothetical protein